jgi:hypothetical protein
VAVGVEGPAQPRVHTLQKNHQMQTLQRRQEAEAVVAAGEVRRRRHRRRCRRRHDGRARSSRCVLPQGGVLGTSAGQTPDRTVAASSHTASGQLAQPRGLPAHGRNGQSVNKRNDADVVPLESLDVMAPHLVNLRQLLLNVLLILCIFNLLPALVGEEPLHGFLVFLADLMVLDALSRSRGDNTTHNGASPRGE